MKIAIYGVGGVGGYLAAQAMKYFEGQNDYEFYLIARGEHLGAIKESGLTLSHAGVEQFSVHPTLATDKIEQCGDLDYIIYATKSYSIDQNIESLRAVANSKTTIITFMNGVDGAQRLREGLPGVNICEGCVYIYSKILSPGVIDYTGGGANYMIGDKAFYDLMSPAVNKISYFENIGERIWNKFGFISPFATMTTWFNITSDQIAASKEYRDIFKSLCDEFEAVALAKCESFESGLYERNIALVEKSPVGSTSSMQRDYYTPRESELYSLTTYISKQGAELGVPTPCYSKANDKLVLV